MTGMDRMEHGTYAIYYKGCRCDACRAAAAAYSREYRARRKAKLTAKKET